MGMEGDSMKRCEIKMGHVIQVVKGDDGVEGSTVKMARVEINRPVVKLAPVFFDGVPEIDNRDADVGANFEQKHAPSD